MRVYVKSPDDESLMCVKSEHSVISCSVFK